MRIRNGLLARIHRLVRDDPRDEPDSRDEFEPIDYPELDERALTNEERVLQVLRENAGTLWQSQFISETGWSTSKVSRVLCELDDDNTVYRVQRGRQNLVCLPDSRPDVTPEEFDEIPDPPTP